ncbi:DSBA-like thioredoxin domain protein [Neoconidiobolus thromboides FSU 785]|nr:DSBA-like thioredoxin domain protein [Neoconidiobolus thromboides FSU 785]
MTKLSFYFEYSSPYSAIAAIRLKDLYHSGQLSHVELDLKPILLGIIFKQNGYKGDSTNGVKSKAKYFALDFTRSSVKQLGYPLTFPKKFPLNSSLAALLTLYLINSQPSSREAVGKLLNFIAYVFIAGFQKHDDISKVNVLKQCLSQSFPELDADKVLSLASNNELKEQLRKITEEAIEADIFGAPFFIVKNQLYWGQDRLDEALQLCEHNQKAKL